MQPMEKIVFSLRAFFGDVVEWFEKRRGWFTKRHIIIALIVLFAIFVGMHLLHKRMVPKGMVVKVAEVKKETIPIFYDYVGNTSAINMVDIRARVEGFLENPSFTEGADVNKGALIFSIDPRPFQAQLDQAQGQLSKDEAALAFAREQVKRYEPLVKKDYVTRENFDNYKTKADEAAAAVEADRAAVEQARLNLSYCKMYSPISGRIGRMYVTLGNLVGAAGQDTKLATIVQLDPLYVYFSPSETDIHNILMKGQKDKLAVEISFADGTKFPHKGTVDFIDNKVDQNTSTVAMRAVVPNPEKTLLPGLYVQTRLIVGASPGTLLIPEQAIAQDQQGAYSLVVGKGNVVEERHIKTSENYDGSSIVTDGLAEGEMVITAGLQLVRAGTTVIPQLEEKKEPGLRDLFMKALFAPKK